jgi:hypothetical protein
VLISNPRKEYQQCVVTMSKDDKNRNGKGTTKTKLIGRKDRKISKKRYKFENLQKVPKGTLHTKNLQNGSFPRISE